MNAVLLLPIVFPILAGAVLALLKLQNSKVRAAYVITVAAINSLMVFALFALIGSDEVFTIFKITTTMPIQIMLDGPGRVFAGLVAFLWPLACAYAVQYMKHEGKENTFFTFYLMTYGITVGIAFAANLVTMYFFYEFLTLVTLPIVMHGMKEKSIFAGRKYLLYSIGGAGFAFMGMIVLSVYSGVNKFRLGGFMPELTAREMNIMLVMYLLMVFGFGVKAAIFPLHGWLPTASVAPTPVTALLHAVAVVNSGAFAILRVTYYVFGVDILSGRWVQHVVLVTAMITILYGSGMALKEQHFKRRLAYSTISILSYMVFGIAFMSPAGMVGAMSHMVFHGIIKITLFYVAGAVLFMTGKNYVNDLFGFGKKMPVMFACFTLSSAALVGVPLTAGFISKWNLISAAAKTADPVVWAGVPVLLVSAVLTAMYLFAIVMKAYFPGPGFSEELVSTVKDPEGGYMKVPMVILCITIVVLGVCSTPFISYLERIASSIL